MKKSKTKIMPCLDFDKPPFIKVIYTFEIESYEEYQEKNDSDDS